MASHTPLNKDAVNADAADGESDAADLVTVCTRLRMAMSLPPNSERKSLRTERLLLRPLRADDAEALYVLRTQAEVMIWTTTLRADPDMDYTREVLSRSLPPNDVKNFNFAICLRGPGDGDGNQDSGEFIGIGGCHVRQGMFGWPEIGYMFRTEHWGKGLATEFLRGFLTLYETLPLPPEPLPIKIKRSSLVAGLDEVGETATDTKARPAVVAERLVAVTTDENKRSQNVLRKAGFVLQTLLDEPDLRDLSQMITLQVFQYFPADGTAKT